jgi:hypothetical protein
MCIVKLQFSVFSACEGQFHLETAANPFGALEINLTAVSGTN